MSDFHIHIPHKIYSNSSTPIIENFELSLKKHEFVCLEGQSGCGKTTLLNSIAGLEKTAPMIKNVKMGYVFQNPRLLPWRTIRENIELVFDNLTPNQTKMIDDLLEITQLLAYQHYYPNELSEGMKRRVSIIRAFAINPDLLLMDEPFVSLDNAMAREIRQLLMKLWLQRPHTVLFVTHDLREAIALADKLVFLSAKPMRVIKEISVSIPRNARNDEMCIEDFRKMLLKNYPEFNV